jgi:hypothetical protein
MNADLSAWAQRTEIAKNQQQSSEHLHIHEFIVQLCKLPFNVADERIISPSLEQVTMRKFRGPLFGNPKPGQPPVAIMSLDIWINGKILKKWFECLRVYRVFRSHAKQKTKLEPG